MMTEPQREGLGEPPFVHTWGVNPDIKWASQDEVAAINRALEKRIRARKGGVFSLDELRAAAYADVPQRLYDSEINFSLACFWDGGFEVKLGDGMNGFAAETQVRTYREALAWLDARAREHYPQSRYAA